MTPKLELVKSAIDFALANHEADAITQAEESIKAFKATGGNVNDLQTWNSVAGTYLQQFSMIAKQKLPSELIAQRSAQAPEAPVSNASALGLGK